MAYGDEWLVCGGSGSAEDGGRGVAQRVFLLGSRVRSSRTERLRGRTAGFLSRCSSIIFSLSLIPSSRTYKPPQQASRRSAIIPPSYPRTGNSQATKSPSSPSRSGPSTPPPRPRSTHMPPAEGTSSPRVPRTRCRTGRGGPFRVSPPSRRRSCFGSTRVVLEACAQVRGQPWLQRDSGMGGCIHNVGDCPLGQKERNTEEKAGE